VLQRDGPVYIEAADPVSEEAIGNLCVMFEALKREKIVEVGLLYTCALV
jgi:hypothetical protein